MLLFISFFILKYVDAKINRGKAIRRIKSDFEIFKLTATTDEFILNVVNNFYLDGSTTTANAFNKLLHAKNITEFIDISDKYRIPIQHLLFDWNYLPAQDSLKHLLNILNDDCIQEILRKLTNASDFLNAAKTCQRFQVNAVHRISSDYLC